jgi:DNA-directed RNA polymerase specialized sigma24 family protein
MADVTTSRDEQFRAYVVASRGKLLRTATFLVSGDRFAAEDLVQTALIGLYVAWPRVRAETVDAYTRKSMLNALIDHRRRPFVRHERSWSRVPDLPFEDVPATDPGAAVFAALAALPPGRGRLWCFVTCRSSASRRPRKPSDAVRELSRVRPQGGSRGCARR